MEKKRFPFRLRIFRNASLRMWIHNQRQSILRLEWPVDGWRIFEASKPLKLYWKAYGGWAELFQSSYLWLALGFTLLTFPLWIEIDLGGKRLWSSLPTSILPNLLGFSMGGMAIMLAFSGSKVFEYITEEGKTHSYFIKIVSSFYHFIMAQVIAIFFGLLCQTYSWALLSFFGYWSMCYALLVAPATAAQLFNTARIANIAASIPDKSTNNSDKTTSE